MAIIIFVTFSHSNNHYVCHKLNNTNHFINCIPSTHNEKTLTKISRKSALWNLLLILALLHLQGKTVFLLTILKSGKFFRKSSTSLKALVTSFVELNKHVIPLPAKLPKTYEFLQAVAKWKHILITDLKSAFFSLM